MSENRLALSEQGRKTWQNQGYDRADFVLVLPGEDRRLEQKIHMAFEARLGGRVGFLVQGQQTLELLALYSLYAFTDKIIIGSFDLPAGRKLHHLLGCGIATEEELIHDVLLGGM